MPGNNKKMVLCINGEKYEVGGGGPSIFDKLVDGTITDFEMPQDVIKVKSYLCAGDQQLLTVNLAGCTIIEESAFYDCRNVNSIDLSQAHISVLGKKAFTSIGCGRENPSENPLVLDFRSSSFNTIEEATFGTDSNVGRYMTYSTIYFPETVKTITNGALRYLHDCVVYFTGLAPQLLGSGVFTGYNNLKIFCDYRDLYNYKYGSNWTAISSLTKGYCPQGRFEVGAQLPSYDQSGHALTWYSDESLTTVITEAIDGEMFCSVSSTLAASNVDVIVKNATVVISDGVNTYDSDNPIPHGTEVTITVTGDEHMEPYIMTINGQPLTSGATFTAAANSVLTVVAIYWDEENVPVSPVLEENSWPVIARICREGRALDYWRLGDTKTILYQGLTYHIRLCDVSDSRYPKSNGSGGNKVVFEFVEQLAVTQKMNSTNTNSGGYQNSAMRKTVMPSLFDDLPSELKELICEVDITSIDSGASASGSGNLTTSPCKLFLPSEYEIFGKRTYSNALEVSTQYGLYAANNTNAFRIKMPIGGTASNWWLRSPSAGNTSGFCNVYTSGSANHSSVINAYRVAPCFCF